MIIAPILSIADRNFGYFFGLFVALFLLWQSGWNWAKFGFGKRINPSPNNFRNFINNFGNILDY